jgi:hypothetical protein
MSIKWSKAMKIFAVKVLRSFHKSIILIFCGISIACFAQTSVKIKVEAVHIRVKADNAERAVSGGLFRIATDGLSRTRLAEVTSSGAPSPVVECDPSDRLIAEPELPIYQGDKTPKYCQAKLAFDYKEVRFATSQMLTGINTATMNSWGAIHEAMTDAYLASAKSDPAASAVARDAAIAAAARALGDSDLDKFVVRDPAQKNQLVLTVEGVNRLKQYQVDQKIPKTGSLDFPTQQALKKGPMPGSIANVHEDAIPVELRKLFTNTKR